VAHLKGLNPFPLVRLFTFFPEGWALIESILSGSGSYIVCLKGFWVRNALFSLSFPVMGVTLEATIFYLVSFLNGGRNLVILQDFSSPVLLAESSSWAEEEFSIDPDVAASSFSSGTQASIFLLIVLRLGTIRVFFFFWSLTRIALFMQGAGVDFYPRGTNLPFLDFFFLFLTAVVQRAVLASRLFARSVYDPLSSFPDWKPFCPGECCLFGTLSFFSLSFSHAVSLPGAQVQWIGSPGFIFFQKTKGPPFFSAGLFFFFERPGDDWSFLLSGHNVRESLFFFFFPFFITKARKFPEELFPVVPV